MENGEVKYMEIVIPQKRIEIPDNYLIGYPDGFSKTKKILNDVARVKHLDTAQIELVKEIEKDLRFCQTGDKYERGTLTITQYGKFRLITSYSCRLFYNLIDVKEQAHHDAVQHSDEMCGDWGEEEEEEYADETDPEEKEKATTLQTGVIGHFWKGTYTDGSYGFEAIFDNYDLGGGNSIFGSDISCHCSAGCTDVDSLKDYEARVQKGFSKKIRLILMGEGKGIIWLGDL